ncbi:MAG TPA: Gfo/Idh/MocA family oxidoreductase [Anaerolineales bacterium]|jgi:predicted dehydrogenase
MTDSRPVRIGILGAAAIVPMALTGPARSVADVEIAAVAARDPARARPFARKHRIPRVHATYADLLADPAIDAVYNPLPNGLHAEWTIRALRAGKHVLCEKPFASNADEAEQMARAAAETGLVLSEAFAYRYHPLAARMQAILASGALGRIQHFNAEFCFLLPSPGDIRFKYELAGGAMMDAGCYPVSLIRFLSGAEPDVVRAKARLLSPQVDRRMSADLSFADGRTAHLVCNMLSPQLFRSVVSVRGEAGELRVISPFQPHIFNRLTVRTRAGRRSEHVRGGNSYSEQLRAFVRAIRGQAKLNTDPADAIGNMRVIDAIYDKAGLKRRGM